MAGLKAEILLSSNATLTASGSADRAIKAATAQPIANLLIFPPNKRLPFPQPNYGVPMCCWKGSVQKSYLKALKLSTTGQLGSFQEGYFGRLQTLFD